MPSSTAPNYLVRN